MLNTLRYVKRHICTGGYSAPVYQFLKEIWAGTPNTFHPIDGRFLVNLSFDLEFGFNSPLWERDPNEAIKWGEIGKQNALSVFTFLRHASIPFNVQIVGGLLDENFTAQQFLSETQRNFIIEHNSLYQLSEGEQKVLANELIELGIHGFSHRRFSNLSQEEAGAEIKKSKELLHRVLGRMPHFMSFPKNNVAHADVLKENGIIAWRSNTHNVSLHGEIPLGLWLAPGNFSLKDFNRLLSEIKILRPQGFFLHLWNHCTETDEKTLADLIAVIQKNNFSFTTVSKYLG